MKGEYKLKSEKLYPLYSEAKKMENTFDKILYEHIYRQYNTRADELSNEALEDQEFYDEVKSGFK
jgi:ribonuclease HI